MLFNSIDYLVFLALVLGAYWFCGQKLQNRLLLAASYFFYGYWEPSFLALILASTLIDFRCALGIDGSDDPRRRKFWLGVSLVCNLGTLGFFKYYNFFAESFAALAHGLGFEPSVLTLYIVLPVGISFYTFQTLSYTIDVYRGEIRPTHQFLDFALYVSFFPQLVAGPIERSSRLLPQIQGKRSIAWRDLQVGVWRIYWGLFKKVVIADNMAALANPLFSSGSSQLVTSPVQLLLALYAFAIQIYCDFSGYSDVAVGSARLLGFRLMENFRLPYLAQNPREFWQRWHISLSTWLRDYLYIPLGGNRQGPRRTQLNLLLTMLLGGLWHGAAWTFVVWGFLHGLWLVLHRGSARFLAKLKTWMVQHIGSWSWSFVAWLLSFHIICLTWLFFRAASLEQAMLLLSSLASPWAVPEDFIRQVVSFCGLFLPLLWVQVQQHRRNQPDVVLEWPWLGRWLFYALMFNLFLLFGAPNGEDFIYFQF